MSTPLPAEPRKKTCLERTIIFLIRLFFAFVVGIAIGVGIYFGVRLLYGEYQSLIQNYDSRITALETNQAEANQLAADRLSGFQTRLETLEIQGDTQKGNIAGLSTEIESLDARLYQQATAIPEVVQISQAGMQETILAMQTQIGIVQSDLESLQTVITDFQEDITALEATTSDLADGLEEHQAALEAMNESVLDTEARMTALEHQMVLLQAMELLTRARLNLVQGNTTLAQSDIEAARDLLIELQAELPAFQVEYVGEIIIVLDDTLKFLPGAPLTAADMLESAWQMLATGLPDASEAEAEAASDETPTPEPTLEITPTPTPSP